MGAKVSQDVVFVLQSGNHGLYVSHIPSRHMKSKLPSWAFSLCDAKIWHVEGHAKNAAKKLELRTAHQIRIVCVTRTLSAE